MWITKRKLINDHFDSLMRDEDNRQWFPRFWAAMELIKRMSFEIICQWRGHSYEPDGCDYVESGGEGFYCKRCGISFTAWH